MMKKILVIEDEPEMRRNVLTILRLEKFEGLGAANGREGVEIARREKPDVILCDIMMPELDGYGVLAELRQEPDTAGIPLIFLTARAEKTEVRGGLNRGAAFYLAKPVDRADLLWAIEECLQKSP